MNRLIFEEYYYSLLMLGIALAAGYMASLIVALILKKISRLRFRSFSINLDLYVTPLHILLPLLALGVVSPFLQFPKPTMDMIGQTIQTLIIATVGGIIFQTVSMIREIILYKYNITVKDNLGARKLYTQTKVIENIIKFFVSFLTISFMIMAFPQVRHIGVSLLASAGVMGIILGFAAQKVLGNLLAGIQIAFTQPIRIDDVVIVDNEWGNIEEITLTYVVIRIWDLRRLVVPISYFLENSFQNWTRVSAELLTYVMVYTDYTVPLDELRHQLTSILEKSVYWDKKVNVLQVTDLQDKTVQLRALMSAVDSSTAWNLQCEVREGMLTFLQKNYPQSLPKVRLELKEMKIS